MENRSHHSIGRTCDLWNRCDWSQRTNEQVAINAAAENYRHEHVTPLNIYDLEASSTQVKQWGETLEKKKRKNLSELGWRLTRMCSLEEGKKLPQKPRKMLSEERWQRQWTPWTRRRVAALTQRATVTLACALLKRHPYSGAGSPVIRYSINYHKKNIKHWLIKGTKLQKTNKWKEGI